MSARRRKGRPLSGALVLDKPQGWTSGLAVQRVKRLFGASKVGHTGSLDQLATGVLPLCFGEATKLSGFLLNSDKSYEVRIRLGVRTDSGDAQGKVIATREVAAYDVDQTKVEAALGSVSRFDCAGASNVFGGEEARAASLQTCAKGY